MPRIRTEADHAPRAVFRVTQEREPGRTIVIRHRSVIEGENPTNYILTYAEGQGDLLGDTGTSPRWIALLHINNGTNNIRSWDLLAQASRGTLAKTANGICAEPEPDGNSTQSMV
ncbi:MAG TPA: hypothetical protein VKK06_16480 [Terriglobia bacterium]|nr:hypothetical protein [Terriglobia bacterium]